MGRNRMPLVEQLRFNFGLNHANCEISTKFGMNFFDRSLFQKKVLATRKIQYGDHFSK